MYTDDEPKYYGVFGCFNAHTSGFWGLRVEFYIIAEDRSTGMLTWVIADYDTNTITYDPKHGLSDPNATGSIMTVDYNGGLVLDMKNNRGRGLVLTSDIKQGKMKSLGQRLWIEGNLSIVYGRSKSEDNPGLFSLIFNPDEFKEALRIPKEALNIELNNWFPGLFKDKPEEVLCFPYAQHFLSDSPGHSSLLKNEKELNRAVENTDFEQIQRFSTKKFKTMFMIGSTVALLVNAALVALLIVS